MTSDQLLYVVDAHAYLHRAYHALPPLTTTRGEPVGALFGFARMLLTLIRRESPAYLVVCFDSPGPTFRHQLYREYKATREKAEPALVQQLGLAEEMVRAMGLATLRAPGFEADDLLATVARRGAREGLRVVLVSGDKDALQLVDDRIQVLNEAKHVVYDAGKVMEKFKVRPEQVADYLAIVGDVSDNIPGIPGIGPVGAAKLLGRYGSLEGILKAARQGLGDIPPKTAQTVVANEEKAVLSRRLTRLDDATPVDLDPKRCPAALRETPELKELFARFEFHSLLREIVPGPGVPSLERRAPPAEPGPLAAVRCELTAPEKVLNAAKKAPTVAIAVSRAGQMDLFNAAAADGARRAGLCLAIALEDGRAAEFSGGELDRSETALRALLAAEQPAKCGHDLKSALRLLAEGGFPVSGCGSDTMLAAYCLDPGRPGYGLAEVLRARGAAAGAEPSPAEAACSVWTLRAPLEAELAARGLDKLYRDLELPVLEVLADMELAGVAVDVPYLKVLRGEFERRIAALQGEIDDLAGVALNLKSTKQLAELFYDKLRLEVPHKTKKGGRSTDEEALRILAPLHPIPAKITEYRELTKLTSTYILAFFDKLDPRTGRIHSHFDQAGTATGRLSSLDPNLQNIPVRTPEGKKIRRAVIAAPGRVLLSADYSQIDLRALAHLSEDPVLCGAFARGDDIHLQTASEVFGVPREAVDKEMRRRAKAVNFGIVYGQSAHGLSAELGISHKEAEDIIARHGARYPGLQAWRDRTLAQARQDGSVRTLLGRVRLLPEINSRIFAVRGSQERMAVNTPIQGTSADIIKAAMVNIHRKMKAGRPRRWEARLILQVHDELLFELPEAEAGDFGAWVRAEMEDAVRLRVPVIVDLKTGRDWLDMRAVAKGPQGVAP